MRLTKLLRPMMAALLRSAAFLLWGCSETQEPSHPALTLVREAKLNTLLGSGTFEASGVTLRNNSLYVVFDNRSSLGIVNPSFEAGRLTDDDTNDSQYEAISYVASTGHFLVSQESRGSSQGAILELALEGNVVSTYELTQTFEEPNKALEGLSALDGSTPYILALCEGHSCTADTSSKGAGRLLVLEASSGVYKTTSTIDLPESIGFRDFSDLAVYPKGDSQYVIGILSQESSALWVGHFNASTRALTDEGQVYVLPRQHEQIQYCSAEGLTFLSATTVVIVSDKSDDSACQAKDQSIHLFTLP